MFSMFAGAVGRMLAVLCAGLLMITTTACSPQQEQKTQQIVNDLNAVVTLAGTVLSVAQAFGALDTPQAAADMHTADAYAGALSAVTANAIAEWNSSDTYTVKANKIAAMITSVAPIAPLTNAKINAAVQALSAAVTLTLAELGVAPPVLRANVRLVSLATSARAHFGLTSYIPGTQAHRVKSIYDQAAANAALAAKLLGK